jgi:hypothetical protein
MGDANSFLLSGHVSSGCEFTGDGHICGQKILGLFDWVFDPVATDCDTTQDPLPFKGRVTPKTLLLRYIAGD